MSFFWRISGLITFLVFSQSSSAAQPVMAAQSHESIVNAAKKAVSSHTANSDLLDVRITVRPLDRRLRLAQCSQPLETELPQQRSAAGSVAVKVICEGENPWRIFVRTTISGNILLPALIRPMKRDNLVTDNDIQLIKVAASHNNPGIVSNRRHLIGMQLKRDIAANTPIRASFLKAPVIVKRGQQVTVIINNQGLEIKMAGIAMRNGTAGELIPVKNSTSQKIVDGIVQKDATVKLL